MKILFLSSSLTRSAGGLYNSVSGLAKALAAQGVEMGVVGGADQFFEGDKHQWGELPLYPYPLDDKGYGFSAGVFGQLKRLAPDLVHIHGIWSANSVYGRAASLMGIPTVVSPRGMLDPWILARSPMVKAVHSTLFEKPLLRRAYVHALNEPEREAVTAYMPAQRDRVFVVPNGIPPAKLPETDAPRRGTLFLGRLHSKKQVLELARMWRKLDLPAGEPLIIAGWGDPAYEAEIREAVAGSSNVEFVGPLHGEAKSAAFMRARFFILPSLSEGLPMAVLEAIQHGCIPIITEECNLPELFRDNIALRMKTDFSDFAQVMAQALAIPENEMKDRSEIAAAYAQNYAWPRIAQAMLTQYEDILASSGPRERIVASDAGNVTAAVGPDAEVGRFA